MFTVKVSDAAKRNGMSAHFVRSESELAAKLPEQPSLVVVDLNLRSADPVRLIRNLKEGESKHIPLLAFVSHVEGALKKSAIDAGCDTVLARSAFSENMMEMFRRYSETF